MSADADDLEAHLAAWVDGMDDELRFWEGWLAGHGLQWADDYAGRLNLRALCCSPATG